MKHAQLKARNELIRAAVGELIQQGKTLLEASNIVADQVWLGSKICSGAVQGIYRYNDLKEKGEVVRISRSLAGLGRCLRSMEIKLEETKLEMKRIADQLKVKLESH